MVGNEDVFLGRFEEKNKAGEEFSFGFLVLLVSVCSVCWF